MNESQLLTQPYADIFEESAENIAIVINDYYRKNHDLTELQNNLNNIENDYLSDTEDLAYDENDEVDIDMTPTISLEQGLKKAFTNILVLPYTTDADIDTEFTNNGRTLSNIEYASHASLDSAIGKLLQSQGYYPSDLVNESLVETNPTLQQITDEIDNAYDDEPNVIAIPMRVSLWELLQLADTTTPYTIDSTVGIYNPINGSSSLFNIEPDEPLIVEPTAPIMLDCNSIGWSLSEIIGDDIFDDAQSKIEFQPKNNNQLKGIQLTLF